MSTLEISRDYSDGEEFTEAQLDAIKSDVETFFNTTGVGDDNIQNAGLTASDKLASLSVSSVKFALGSVTSVKLVDDAVTTAKLATTTVSNQNYADNAVTNAKLATLASSFVPGTVIDFYGYNNALDIPRGWMICNGQVINETNYNTLHGSGTYTTDGIASSAILGKYLPDFEDVYGTGAATTTQDGSSAITTVGNANHQTDYTHTHTVPSHTHTPDEISYAAYSGASPVTFVGAGAVTKAVSGAQTTTLATGGSATFNIKPESIRFIKLMKVV